MALDQLADAVGTRWLAWREGGVGGGSLACTRGLHAGAKEVSCCTYRGLAADAEKRGGGGTYIRVGREHATCIANYAGGRKVNKRGNDPYIVSASCSDKASHDSTLCALSPTIHPPMTNLVASAIVCLCLSRRCWQQPGVVLQPDNKPGPTHWSHCNVGECVRVCMGGVHVWGLAGGELSGGG